MEQLSVALAHNALQLRDVLLLVSQSLFERRDLRVALADRRLQLRNMTVFMEQLSVALAHNALQLRDVLLLVSQSLFERRDLRVALADRKLKLMSVLFVLSRRLAALVFQTSLFFFFRCEIPKDTIKVRQQRMQGVNRLEDGRCHPGTRFGTLRVNSLC